MIKILPLAAVLIGGLVAPALANPDFDSECKVLGRDKAGVVLGLASLETADFNAAQVLSNGAAIVCRANLGPGATEAFNKANTGFDCKLGPAAHPLLITDDWLEKISADGETTLLCFFHK